MSTQAVVSRSKLGSIAWMVVIVAVTLLGLALWIYQQVRGLYVTDMRNLTSWSLYITMFTVAEAFAAGCLLVATMPQTLGVKGFRSLTRVASYLAIACIVMSGIFIAADMGRPERVFNILAHGRIGSPMFGDFILVILFFIVAVAYLATFVRAEKRGGSSLAVGILARIGFVVALLLPTATAWLFGLQIGRPVWNSPLMAPSFIIAAAVAGLALLIGASLILRSMGRLTLESDDLSRMARMLGLFVIAELFVLLCELLTASFPGAGPAYDAVMSMVSGGLAPLFWIEVAIGGILAAVLLLVPALRRRSGFVATGAILAILGVLISKFDLILSGFDHPNLDYPGVVTGPVSPVAGSSYVPTLVEWGLVVGVVAFGLVIATLGLKRLAVKLAK